MVNVDFIGRLGRDAEVKVSGRGNKYIYFTVATDTWDSAAKEAKTEWLDVSYQTSNPEQFIERLKKGWQVCVHGTETISLSQANGQNYIHRNVWARSVDPVFGPRREDNQNGQNQVMNPQMGGYQRPVAQQMPQQAPNGYQQPVPQPQGQPMAQPQAQWQQPQAPQFPNGGFVQPTPQGQPMTQQMPQQAPQQMPFPPSIDQNGNPIGGDLPF